jgi:hypothetical protein
MQILKKTDTDWPESSLIRKLYMDQSVKLKLSQAERRSVKTGRMLFVADSVQIVQRIPYQGSLGRIWRLRKIKKEGRQVICTLKYADSLVLMAK